MALPNNTLLIKSYDEMKAIIEKDKSLEGSVILLKRVRETIQNEAKDQKGWFLSMLLRTLSASLLGNILAGKRAIAKSISQEKKSRSQDRGVNRGGEGAIAKSVSEETKSRNSKSSLWK